MVKILFLAANPIDTVWLRVDKESRAIDKALRQSEFRDEFQIEKEFAVQVSDLSNLLLRYQPDIVHFSGHGSEQSEIILEDDGGNSQSVPAQALSRMFSAFKDHLRCVVLNACYSERQAQAISEHIDCVVGMSDAITDSASIKFATSFYLALGYGRDIQTAFNLGCIEINLANLGEQDKPKLLATKGNLSELIFAKKGVSPRFNRCDFYQHIALPPNYVPRPELLAEIRSVLLADRNSSVVALTSAVKINAMHGMGGIGKSVMARALCDDPTVQAAFPDGILWTTLGQTPDLVARLREWADALGVAVSDTVATVNVLKNKLTQSLAKRSCLIIIDDVWHVSDVEAFLIGGPNCCVLLTTRDAATAEELDANIQPIPVMTQAEAIALLIEWGGEQLHQGSSALLVQIVQRLGRLPLAIKLAGGQLRRQVPKIWLENFDIHQLKSRRVEDIHDSLETTFTLSFDKLSNTDCALYTSLAIFKEDEAIPAVAITRLWSILGELDEDNTIELLDDLEARALLQLNPGQTEMEITEASPGDQSAHWRTVILHDLLRDFISAKLGETGKVRAHQALLVAYRKTRSDESWASAADDGYLYNHLVYHLHRIVEEDQIATVELKALFDNQAWLHARVPAANYEYDGYIADLMLTWQYIHTLFHNQLKEDQLCSAFTDCVRYALIRTSLNSLAANYEPALVARAIDLLLWLPSRALSVASRIPDAKQRSTFIKAILETQPFQEPHHQEVRRRAEKEGLASALAIAAEWSRAEALEALAPQLSGEVKEQALQAALAAVLATPGEESKAHIFAKYLLFSLNKEYLLKQVCEAVGNTLLFRLKDQPRDKVLKTCANSCLPPLAIFPTESLEGIAKCIIEVCREWEWL